MTFTTDVWESIAPIRAAIEAMPFLQRLRDGSLERERFTYYMRQDALYLADYGRALAACAAQASDPDDLVFWAGSAQQTVVVERELHAAHVAGGLGALDELREASPTCTAYTSFLLALSTRGCYPALAAGDPAVLLDLRRRRHAPQGVRRRPGRAPLRRLDRDVRRPRVRRVDPAGLRHRRPARRRGRPGDAQADDGRLHPRRAVRVDVLGCRRPDGGLAYPLSVTRDRRSPR